MTGRTLRAPVSCPDWPASLLSSRTGCPITDGVRRNRADATPRPNPVKELVGLLAIAAVCAQVSAADGALFRVRTNVPGVDYLNVCGSKEQLPILEQNGQGIGVIDFDDDGLMDLFVPNGSTEALWRKKQNPGCRLYRNLGNWRFADVTESAGVRGNAWSCGVAVADYDADGDFDIYVPNWGPNVLYRNNGDGTFADVTTEAGVGDAGWGSSAAFADISGDRRLDLYVSNYVAFRFDDYPTTEKDGKACLYRDVVTGCGPWCYEGQRDTLYVSTGGGRFEDRSVSFGLDATSGFRGFGVVAADLDDDRDIDIFVGCDVMPNLYLENRGSQLTSVGMDKGGALNAMGKHESGMGVAMVDLDRTGSPDLLVTNFAGETNTYYLNSGGQLTDATAAVRFGTHASEMGWGACARDFDQDGRSDVFVANGHIYPQVAKLNDPEDTYAQSPRFFRQDTAHRLREVAPAEAFDGVAKYSLRGAAAVDLDNDGDLDLVAIQHNGPLVFFENRSNRPALTLELVHADGGRSPWGALVTLPDSEPRWVVPTQGFQSSQDHRIFISPRPPARRVPVEVRWPNGIRERFMVDTEQRPPVRLREGGGVVPPGP